MKLFLISQTNDKPNISIFTGKFYLHSVHTEDFLSQPFKIIETILRGIPHFIFLDKEVNINDGIEMLNYLSKSLTISMFTFSTSAQLVVPIPKLEGERYKAVSFSNFMEKLLEPISKLAQEALNSKSLCAGVDHFFLKTGKKGKIMKLSFSDITLIEGMGNYVAFHYCNKTIVSHFTLKQLETILPKEAFIRVHKSYIVPLNKIESLTGKRLKIESYVKFVPVGLNYKQVFLEKLNAI
jgi:two-component system, LytTR family, response regulator